MSSSRNISREWLREEVILLIEFYNGFPIIWNVRSSDYKKRNIQMLILRKFKKRLSTTISSITIEDIKDKIQELRTQYLKERIRIRSSSRNGLELFMNSMNE